MRWVSHRDRLVEEKPAADAFLTTAKKGLDERVRRADDVRPAGVTLNRTVRGLVDDLQKCLARGGSVKVLLIDPRGTVPEEADWSPRGEA
ncbi:hypothetical protein [Nonomuraea sp. B1E8]|uniref:hypothetical protein n=1 Tax=unclassified Nonomuraea TaxID=2593643 RepID=UPI00325D5D19